MTQGPQLKRKLRRDELDDLGRKAVSGVGGGLERHLAILAQPCRSGHVVPARDLQPDNAGAGQAPGRLLLGADPVQRHPLPRLSDPK